MFVKDFRKENDEKELVLISPLAYAFVGDTVFDLFLRTRVVLKRRITPKKMQLDTAHYARAKAQAAMAGLIEEELSAEEADVLRRARNTRVNSIPKHASVAEYKMATAFEALIGWLYISGRNDRLDELIHLAVDRYDEAEKAVSEEKNHAEE